MWTKRLGSIDAITWSILEGKLVMPKSSFPAKPSWKPNHPSWNLIAKTALGPTLATWITQGIVEVGISLNLSEQSTKLQLHFKDL
jgi:hypothetical protein